jgi:hypothetical protein
MPSSSARNKLFLLGLGLVCWALWKTQNRMAFEKKLVKLPHIIVHNIICLMQQWRVLLPKEEQELVTGVVKRLKMKMGVPTRDTNAS